MRLLILGSSGTVGFALQHHLQSLAAEGLVADVATLEGDALRDMGQVTAMASCADIVVFCLPDQQAEQYYLAVRSANSQARFLDASARFRTDSRWTYGLPEVVGAEAIAKARRVANPGCLATGCILLGRIIAWHLRETAQATLRPWLAFQGITGYSAMGNRGTPRTQLAQMGKSHRHLPEIARYGEVTPVLTTFVGQWRQGMIVQTTVPLPTDALWAASQLLYAETGIILLRTPEMGDTIDATTCNGTNAVQLQLTEHPRGAGTTLTAVYDNLGKGSAAAAANNLRLMIKGQA